MTSPTISFMRILALLIPITTLLAAINIMILYKYNDTLYPSTDKIDAYTDPSHPYICSPENYSDLNDFYAVPFNHYSPVLPYTGP